MLKAKIIRYSDEGIFEYELEKFMDTIGPASIQYRTSVTTNNRVIHSALVIYEIEEKEEEDGS